MKVLITGKNGQLGSELENDAKEKGWKVYAFDKTELDVTDSEALRTKIKEINPDIFINATAYNLVAEAEENQKNAFGLNAFSVYEMARACKDLGTAFVTYSTDYVFDGKKGSPYIETDEAMPLQAYGMSKATGDLAALDAYPDKSFVIRACALYGGKKGSRAKGGNIVLSLISAINEKPYLEMVADQFVNPTYAKDLSKATFALLEKKPEPGIYHLANEGYCNWVEFAKELLKILKIEKEVREVPASQFPSNVQKPAFSALSNTKAKSLGIVLPAWQEALKNYLTDFSLS